MAIFCIVFVLYKLVAMISSNLLGRFAMVFVGAGEEFINIIINLVSRIDKAIHFFSLVKYYCQI